MTLYLLIDLLHMFNSTSTSLTLFILIMANEMPKRRQINYKNVMCICINWFLKVNISPPLLY